MAYPPYPTPIITIPPHAALDEHRAHNDCGGARSALRIETYERNTT